jgi:ABC-type transporter Mla maintaining outer membrane lipid asymmetry permease subunit MlaE
MQSGRSAEAVGLAATSAVVTSIVLIIVVEGTVGRGRRLEYERLCS